MVSFWPVLDRYAASALADWRVYEHSFAHRTYKSVLCKAVQRSFLSGKLRSSCGELWVVVRKVLIPLLERLA